MVARVDAALSDAMRRVLHHPDFQTAEALWRGLEFLVRRVETSTRLQIVIYDISAEEVAADLAASDALDQSGLYSLLVEQPAMDANQGSLSLLAGLYQFEVTPPHADLLGRVAQLAAVAGAPFVSGVGPDYLKTPLKDSASDDQAGMDWRCAPCRLRCISAWPRRGSCCGCLVRQGHASDPLVRV